MVGFVAVGEAELVGDDDGVGADAFPVEVDLDGGAAVVGGFFGEEPEPIGSVGVDVAGAANAWWEWFDGLAVADEDAGVVVDGL